MTLDLVYKQRQKFRIYTAGILVASVVILITG